MAISRAFIPWRPEQAGGFSSVSGVPENLSQPDVATSDAPECRELINPVPPEHPADRVEEWCAWTGRPKAMTLGNRSVTGSHRVNDNNVTARGDKDKQADEQQRREDPNQEDECHKPFKHRQPRWS